MNRPDNSPEAMRAAAKAQQDARDRWEQTEKEVHGRNAEYWNEHYESLNEGQRRTNRTNHDRHPPVQIPAISGKSAMAVLQGLGALLVIGVLVSMFNRSEAPPPDPPPSTESTSSSLPLTSGPVGAAPTPAEAALAYPGFAGQWSNEAAFYAAWPGGLYDPTVHGPASPGGSINTTDVRYETSFDARYFGENAKVVITSLSEGSCEACGYQLSMFVFAPRPDGWQLIAWSRNFGRSFPADPDNLQAGFQLWPLSNGEPALAIPSRGSHSGQVTESIAAYAFVGQGFVKIFGMDTAHYGLGGAGDAWNDGQPWTQAKLAQVELQGPQTLLRWDITSSRFAGPRRMRLTMPEGAPLMPDLDTLVQCAAERPAGVEIDGQACQGWTIMYDPTP